MKRAHTADLEYPNDPRTLLFAPNTIDRWAGEEGAWPLPGRAHEEDPRVRHAYCRLVRAIHSEARRALPDTELMCYMMVYIRGMSAEKVAEGLELEPSSVRSALSRATSKLKANHGHFRTEWLKFEAERNRYYGRQTPPQRSTIAQRRDGIGGSAISPGNVHEET